MTAAALPTLPDSSSRPMIGFACQRETLKHSRVNVLWAGGGGVAVGHATRVFTFSNMFRQKKFKQLHNYVFSFPTLFHNLKLKESGRMIVK